MEFCYFREALRIYSANPGLQYAAADMGMTFMYILHIMGKESNNRPATNQVAYAVRYN